MSDHPTAELVVIGAGAAGLATAIFAARAAPHLRVLCLDGARHVGAKILVSGGSRCNVTNRTVTGRDFWGGNPRFVRDVLRAFPAERAAAFFAELGVALHEEEDGKLFPDTNRSRTVLDALLGEAARCGVTIETGRRVRDVRAVNGTFTIEAGDACVSAAAVVLATGGRSLPKSGSDGFGYELAARLGHGHVPTTPALAPLLIDPAPAALSGIAHHASMTLRASQRAGGGGQVRTRLEGPILWTHFGVSGPLALNMSRHWHRAELEGRDPAVEINVLPGETFETLEAWWLEQARARPRARAATILSSRLPAAIADAWVAANEIVADATLAHIGRDDRRRLLRALIGSPLTVRGSRGYAYAEVTAGGVPLDEVDPATMESKRRPGLFIVGEILDVDGRLGGFNFQWAWSSGWVAGHAVARRLARR